ncbi:hypothetical protein RFF05_03825 [Bengtsoniella intestinalis]|uniref:hypothetical protein n=1 Tax=Bengtsoniella intestinalis TaxID=3073143 RepID=UPI00391F4754
MDANSQVQTIVPSDFYLMMQMLKSLLNAQKISREVADMTALNLARQCQTSPIYLW